MTAVFEELRDDPKFEALASELEIRPVPQCWVPGPEEAVITAPSEPTVFIAMVNDESADRKFTASLVNTLHELELERASQPPVIHVTVPATPENGLTPGEYEVRTGPQPTVSYRLQPTFTPSTGDDTCADIPVYRDSQPPRSRLTGFLARRHRSAPH